MRHSGQKKKKNSLFIFFFMKMPECVEHYLTLNRNVFGNMFFWIVIFPCVFSNCYLPTGHRGLNLKKKKKRHDIDIMLLNSEQIYRQSTVIYRQCLEIKHLFSCYTVYAPLINYHLKTTSFYRRKIKIKVFYRPF